MVLKEREVLSSTGNAPACQATAYHPVFFNTSTPVTRASPAYQRVLGEYPDGAHSMRAWSFSEPLGLRAGRSLARTMHVVLHPPRVANARVDHCVCALLWLSFAFSSHVWYTHLAICMGPESRT